MAEEGYMVGSGISEVFLFWRMEVGDCWLAGGVGGVGGVKLSSLGPSFVREGCTFSDCAGDWSECRSEAMSAEVRVALCTYLSCCSAVLGESKNFAESVTSPTISCWKCW